MVVISMQNKMNNFFNGFFGLFFGLVLACMIFWQTIFVLIFPLRCNIFVLLIEVALFFFIVYRIVWPH